jgi:hypothetical protein
MTMKKAQFSPKKSHYMTFHEAVAVPTFELYGRLINDGEAKPSDLGIFHPTDSEGSLHRSVVFGYATGGQCKSLATPQQVWLPYPDGPADRCGWDPSQYVVWKNAQPDWNTLHVVAERKPLSLAIAAGEPLQDTGASDYQISLWIMQWAAITDFPQPSDLLNNLWALVRKTDFLSYGAPALVKLLSAHNEKINVQSITSDLTVQGLLDKLA